MSNTENKLLMSEANPDGWKLEELLERIAEEIAGKTEQLHPDTCPVNPTVIRNNNYIYTRLLDCVSIQKHTMQLIDANDVLGVAEREYRSPLLGRVGVVTDIVEPGITTTNKFKD